MKLQEALAIGVFLTTVTSHMVNSNSFLTDLITPAALAFTVFQTSLCSAFVLPHSSPSVEWRFEARHHEHYGHEQNSTSKDGPPTNKEGKNSTEEHRKGHHYDRNSTRKGQADGVNNDQSNHDKRKNGTANMQYHCQGSHNRTTISPTGNDSAPNPASTGPGIVPPGFADKRPPPGFIAGQKHRRSGNTGNKQARTPAGPERKLFQALYL